MMMRSTTGPRALSSVTARAMLAALALTLLGGCAESVDEAEADPDPAAEAPESEDEAGGDEAAAGGADQEAPNATLAFDGEDLPVQAVHCTEAVDHDSPSAVLADFVHPDDGQEYQFGVRNHGGSARLELPEEHDAVNGEDRWERYAEPDPDQELAEGEILQLDGVDYSHDGAAGSLELDFFADHMAMEDADFEAPASKVVEFDLACP